MNCRAKNPSTCRVHGTGTAISFLTTTLENKNLSGGDRLTLLELKDRAENPSQDKKALGLTVEYEDGSQEVFTGSATDPYHSTDYSFYSMDTGERIEGIVYSPTDSTNYDPVEQGPHAVKTYQKEFEYATNERILLRSEDGESSSPSEKKVKRIIVL